MAHCEVDDLLRGGYIHDGVYCREHGHKGICSESEWRQVERDIALAEKTGCQYHVCHVSTKESVDLVRQARAKGLKVSCETAPHYLLLCDEDLREEGRFKMNPPLRSRADRRALLEGIADGTIEVIATDHAPHTAAEKARGLAGSAMGIVGLETAFPLLYKYLVLEGGDHPRKARRADVGESPPDLRARRGAWRWAMPPILRCWISGRSMPLTRDVLFRRGGPRPSPDGRCRGAPC